MDDLKLNPYDRLQSIFSEKDNGKLTQNASDKIDVLFGSVKKPSLISKVKSFFEKIDSLIFKPRSRTNNSMYSKRRR